MTRMIRYRSLPTEEIFSGIDQLLSHSVGFDRIFDTMHRTLADVKSNGGSFPPYNIIQLGEHDYEIQMALAGFSPSDVSVSVDKGVLTVASASGDGDATTEGEAEFTYIHRGIAKRAFTHRFRLNAHIVVRGAAWKDGMLNISLHHEVPEELKPRSIDITVA